MSDPRFQDVGHPLDKLIEECAEVIKECVKAKRFGLFNHHPDDPQRIMNAERIKREMGDLEQAMARAERYLAAERHLHFTMTPKLAPSVADTLGSARLPTLEEEMRGGGKP